MTEEKTNICCPDCGSAKIKLTHIKGLFDCPKCGCIFQIMNINRKR